MSIRRLAILYRSRRNKTTETTTADRVELANGVSTMVPRRAASRTESD